jgi:Zn-dependent peptidase ImmA (M78 family)
MGSRIKRRRLIFGYSLDDLKDKIAEAGHSISKSALSKYELDKSVPKATNLWYIARALETSPDYFFRTSNIEVEWIAFRKKTKLSKKSEELIGSLAKEHIEAQLYLNDILDKEINRQKITKIDIGNIEEAEEAAERLRTEWGLGNWPIESVTGLLENSGFFILEIEEVENFDGLSGIADNSLPVIVTVKKNPIDRKRFTLAHELGHLILHTHNIDDEQAACRFAAAFLVPRYILYKKIGTKRKNIDLRELILMKEEYGISIQALIKRCYDLQIISSNIYKSMNIVVRSRGFHRNEPGSCCHKEGPCIMEGKLMRAIAEGYTTESEVLSRFPSLAHFISKRKSVFTDWFEKPVQERDKMMQTAAENAKELYGADGTLSDLEIVDNVWEYNESKKR